MPEKAVANLPLERRLNILEAESDVLAAQDARDAQDEKTLTAIDALKDAGRRVDLADDGLDKERKANGNVDVAQAVLTEAKSRREYARASLALERARLSTADAQLLAAQARFELVRAKEVEAAGEGSTYSVKPAAYQKQVERIAALVAERTEEEKQVQVKAEEAKKAWKTVAAQLALLTGGAQGSVWVQ